MSNYEERRRVVDCREQIQEDLIAWTATIPLHEDRVDELCQIVVDNFKKLEE